MAETKPTTTRDKDASKEAPVVDNRPLRTVEQTIYDPSPPPTPTQEEADAIKLGEYTGEEDAAPKDETPEAKRKREEDDRKKREAKAAADHQAYQTR